MSAPAQGVAYLDASAYVKLVLREPGYEVLLRALDRWPAHVSSVLLRTEAERGCARYGERFRERALAGLKTVALLPLDEAVLAAAGALRPVELRSLDAIHLATALSVAVRRCVLFSYDDRLSTAAAAAGVPVERPA